MFRGDFYLYECMDDSQKEDFYSHLNMEGFNDADYALAERVCKDFELTYFKTLEICILKYTNFIL